MLRLAPLIPCILSIIVSLLATKAGCARHVAKCKWPLCRRRGNPSLSPPALLEARRKNLSARFPSRATVARILRRALRPTQNTRNTLWGNGRRSHRQIDLHGSVFSVAHPCFFLFFRVFRVFRS